MYNTISEMFGVDLVRSKSGASSLASSLGRHPCGDVAAWQELPLPMSAFFNTMYLDFISAWSKQEDWIFASQLLSGSACHFAAARGS